MRVFVQKDWILKALKYIKAAIKGSYTPGDDVFFLLDEAGSFIKPL